MHADLCGALYLTQPGPLWHAASDKHGLANDATAFTDVRPRVRAHVTHELATHAPDIPYASDHRVQAVWGQWVPGYRPVTQPYTSAQRDRVRPAHMRHLQGQTGSPDRVLDAYLKTVPAPLASDVEVRTTSTGAKTHALAAADAMPPPLHPLTRAASSGRRLGGPFRDHAATAASAPLAVAMAARRGRSLAPMAVRAEARRVRRARMPAPAVQTRAVPSSLRVGFSVQPNRFVGVKASGSAGRPPMTSVVTHPWAVTSYAVGRLENHLLVPTLQGGQTNATSQRQETKRRVQWVRTSLRRLRELADWQAACAPGTDLLQPRKVGGGTPSDAVPCPTPSQWRRGLLSQFDRLCPQTTNAAEVAGVWVDALDSLEASWWYSDGRHAAFVAATTIAPADAPLLAHMATPPPHQLNDAARRTYVHQQRPHASAAERAALVQTGEWYARYVLSSDAARRKELSLPSWILTYAAGTLRPHPSHGRAGRRSASSRRTRRQSSAQATLPKTHPSTNSHAAAPRRRRSGRSRSRSRSRRPRSTPPSQSPKKSGGGAASLPTSNVSPTSPCHHIRPVRMDTQPLTHDISVTRAPPTCTASGQCGGGKGGVDTPPAKASGRAHNKKKSGGERTIVLDTRVRGTTTASLGGGKAGKRGGASTKGKKARSLSDSSTSTPLVTVTKQGDVGKTPKHRLTQAEMDAYRKGLHKHVKANGGRAYVEEQQTQQQRKAPAFDFVKLFPKDSPFLKTIPGKLRKSARNRNALRRIKREVLRTYGYHKSATYKQCSGGTASKDPLVGGGGASRRRSSPRLQDGQSKDGYTGALYTRKHRPSDPMSGPAHEAGGGPNTPRVTWNETLSTGETIADASATDMEATQGLSALDLGGLDSVVVG